jgi:cyclopropane-fatty-acyl-phospholipid synthase
MLATRRSHTWIHKYVFPGGQVLSVPAVLDNAALAGLDVTERHSLGPHYARTLRHWRDRFLADWPRVAAAGFDPAFRRMWEFYLAYCEAGFRVGYLDVWQFAMSRPA